MYDALLGQVPWFSVKNFVIKIFFMLKKIFLSNFFYAVVVTFFKILMLFLPLRPCFSVYIAVKINVLNYITY